MIQKLLILFLGLVVALSAAVVLFGDGEALNSATVTISVEGTVVRQTELADTSETVTLQGKNGIESAVVIEGGRVCVDHANCPDQICVNQGWISDSTLPIVCLPGEIIIEIVGGESSGIDMATG